MLIMDQLVNVQLAIVKLTQHLRGPWTMDQA